MLLRLCLGAGGLLPVASGRGQLGPPMEPWRAQGSSL